MEYKPVKMIIDKNRQEIHEINGEKKNNGWNIQSPVNNNPKPQMDPRDPVTKNLKINNYPTQVSEKKYNDKVKNYKVNKSDDGLMLDTKPKKRRLVVEKIFHEPIIPLDNTYKTVNKVFLHPVKLVEKYSDERKKIDSVKSLRNRKLNGDKVNGVVRRQDDDNQGENLDGGDVNDENNYEENSDTINEEVKHEEEKIEKPVVVDEENVKGGGEENHSGHHEEDASSKDKVNRNLCFILFSNTYIHIYKYFSKLLGLKKVNFSIFYSNKKKRRF